MIFNRIIVLFVLILFFPGATIADDASGNSLFSGQIVDTANRPVSGAEVYIFDSPNVKRPADFISNKTLKDGLFRVELPLSRYWIIAIERKSGKTFGPLGVNDRHSGEPIEINLTDPKEVSRDFTVMDLKEAARLNQKRGETIIKITGKILNANGIPVKMAYVMADSHKRFGNLPQYISTWTEADGRYVIYLPKGKFFVGAATDFPPVDDYILHEEAVFNTDTDGVNLIILPVTP